MHDDTLINPDEIHSTEQFIELLVGLGFQRVSPTTGGGHRSARITRETRFRAVFLFNERIMISVLTGNRLWLDVEWPDRDGWGFSDAGELTGPITAHYLTNHITTMAHTRAERAAAYLEELKKQARS